ncbi:MAG: type II secretion system major pseudopilin GspG [Armatimonadetes bacterium]|nr:type II secretion system major pseudopilin GspG [Armatimonadota bacterium]
MRTRTQTTRKRRGFTLIELLVVILILAVLAAMIVPQYFARIDDAKRAKAADDLATMSKLIQTYRMDTGQYPGSDEGLQALLSDPGNVNGWKGPYVQGDIPLDPWGNEYLYSTSGDDGFIVMSYGADNAEGGEGHNEDIVHGTG